MSNRRENVINLLDAKHNGGAKQLILAVMSAVDEYNYTSDEIEALRKLIDEESVMPILDISREADEFVKRQTDTVIIALTEILINGLPSIQVRLVYAALLKYVAELLPSITKTNVVGKFDYMDTLDFLKTEFGILEAEAKKDFIFDKLKQKVGESVESKTDKD